MTGSPEDREQSIARAFKVLNSFSKMDQRFKEKIIRSFDRVADPGRLATEFKKVCIDKGLPPDRGAKYFFRCWMNEVNS